MVQVWRMAVAVGCLALVLAAQPKPVEDGNASCASLHSRVLQLEVRTTCSAGRRPSRSRTLPQAALLPKAEQGVTDNEEPGGLLSSARQLVSLGCFLVIVVLPGAFILHKRDTPEPRWMRLLHPRTNKPLHAQLVRAPGPCWAACAAPL